CKLRLASCIDYLNSFFVGGYEFFLRQLRMLRHSNEQWPVHLVEPLHHCEIPWRLRLIGKQVVDEALLIRSKSEGPIPQFLISHSRSWHSAQCLSTGRARSMRGPDLHVIGKRFKPLQ